MNTFEMTKEAFGEIYGSLTFPAFLFDKDGGLINANQSFLDLTGISSEDITTFSIMSFLKKVFKEGRWSFRGLIDKHVTEITDISGRNFPVGVNYKKLKTEDESYGGGLGFITDLRELNESREKVKKISIQYEALKEQLAGEAPDIDLQERKKLEQDVKEANEFLENVLESCGDGIVIMDATAKIIRANEFFADMLGKKKNEIEGTYIYELTPSVGTFRSTTGETVKLDQSYRDNQMNHAMKLFESGENDQIENWQWYIFHKNGDIIPLETRQTSQRNMEGVLTGIVMSVRDITERKKTEKEVEETKNYLENVIESCGDGIFIIDNTGIITRVNESFASILGKTKEEIEGISIFRLGPSEGTFQLTTGETTTLDQAYNNYRMGIFKREFTQLGNNFKIENLDFYLFHKNGDVVPLELTVTFQQDSEGNFLGGVFSARDIAVRKKAEKEIKEARDFLENVIESCGDGIFITDEEAKIIRVNESFASMLGKKKKEIEGDLFFEMMPLEGTFRATNGEVITLDQTYSDTRTHMFEKKLLQLGDGIKIENLEFYIFHKNGDIIPTEITVTFRQDAEENFIGAVYSVRDIRERKKAEKALKDAYEFQRRFFTNITHEFRTPLTLAIGPLEEILRGEFGKVSKAMREQLTIGLRNSRQLLRLVNQLLDFSRLESGAKQVVHEKKDLKKFIAAITDSFSLIAKKKRIKLTLKPVGHIPHLSIDAGKMEKVLFNLIGNAFKFTPEKGAVTVGIESGRGIPDKIGNKDSDRNDYVKVWVADTGTGIKAEDLETIFDRFRQAEGSSSGEQRGTGIGLAYARELVELMGGRIIVESEYGKGSTFSLYVPVERQEADTEPQVLQAKEELYLQPEVEMSDISREDKTLEECISGKKPVILIVDDNSDVRSYVVSIVKKEYDFITAGNGIEALDKLKKHIPDVILCDVMMPKMDGHEFLKRVKSSPGLQKIPFIFLTARADVEMRVEGLEEGADDYIVKPFNSLELLARMKSLLRLRDLMTTTEAQARKIDTLTQKLKGKYRYGNIIGNTPPMRKIYQLIETIKDSTSNVLITGETGTGKELIANAIHYNSPRKKGSLVSVNCGAIPKELMEREFFGHVKGAYTGAVDSKKGHFEEAHGGTLFLDEIGEMDKDMQVKLLRVLEKGEITRVGDPTPIKVDVRLIVATNKNLLAEVQQGSFREDLYYRTHVIPIHLPPLRQRSEDIPLLIEHFLERFRSKQKKEIPPLTEKEMRLFMNYTFPGNVRELEHMVERFCLLGGNVESLFSPRLGSPTETSSDFIAEEIFDSPKPLKAAAQKAKARAEREVLLQALKMCDNDYAQTAKKLNICLASLYNKIKDYGVNV